MPHTRGFDWTEEKVAELKLMKTKGLTHEQIANEMKTTKLSVNSAVKRYGANTGEIIRPTLPKGITLKDILAKYDTRSAIHEKLKLIARETFLTETDFCSIVSGSDRSRFRRCVELYATEFSKFRIKMKVGEGEAKWLWGHPDDIIKVRAIVEDIP